MSRDWIDMARASVTDALADADLTDVDFSLCEEFTDPPRDLRPDGRRDGRPDGETTIGFFVRVDHGRVEVGDHPIDDADLKIVSTYDDALTIARDPDAPAADESEMRKRLTEGRLQILGDPSAVPEPLAKLDIHRLLASRTA
jgi:hypothetical protein